jgi:hypothetical protein
MGHPPVPSAIGINHKYVLAGSIAKYGKLK